MNISIICPLHNKGEFLAEAIGSVLRQTIVEWEMIVVENGSEDNGPAIVDKFAARDSRVRLVRAPLTVRGPGAARNIGLGLASGEWVLFLDADDLIEAEHLARLLATAQQMNDVDVVAGGWKEFKNDLNSVVTRWPTAFGLDLTELVDSSIAFAPWAVHAAMVRREWLQKNSITWFEDLDVWPSEDTAFWFAVLQGARVAWSDSACALYRVDTANSRNSTAHRARWLEGLKRVIAKNLETLDKRGRKPSATQIATLVRMYESKYSEALNSQDSTAAEAFRCEASQWLRRAEWADVGICARKLFGIKVFNMTSKRWSV
jgi:glycosyltransferase involved in cell wall biosynthesis